MSSSIFACGENWASQLGPLEDAERREASETWRPSKVSLSFTKKKSIRSGRHFSVALTLTGNVYMWGVMAGVRLENPSILRFGDPVVCIAAGDKHAIALTRSGNVFSWGHGSLGRLGHGNMKTVVRPHKVTYFASEVNMSSVVVSVAAGGANTSAITSRGDVFIWGWNRYSQLGMGLRGGQCSATPRQLRHASLNDVIPAKIILSDQHSALVTKKGQLYTWFV